MRLLQLGCGVVGGAYLRAFHEDGSHDVIGADVSASRVAELQKGGLPCCRVTDLRGTYDVILVSVPTPLGEDGRRLTMRYVDSCLATCASHLAPDGTVLIRSTVTPGYCATFERRLRDLGRATMTVAFSPEYLRAHTAEKDAREPWLVVIGADDEPTAVTVRTVFAPFVRRTGCDVVVMRRAEAELQKLVHNHYNALKISYGNAVADVARRLDARIDAVRVLRTVARTAESVLNPNYGFRKVDAPFNGTCLTKDPQHLASLARPRSAAQALLQSAVDMNESLRGTEYDTDYAGCYSDEVGTAVETSASKLLR